MQNNGGEEVFHPKGSGLSTLGYPSYQVGADLPQRYAF
jgi:hypothetical protein